MGNRVNSLENDKKIQAKFTKALAKKGDKYELLWRMGVETGLRISDLLSLKVQDVLMYPVTVKEQKTGKTREFTLSEKLAADIWAYTERRKMWLSDYLFPGHGKRPDYPELQQAMTRQQAHRVISSVAADLGLAHVGTHSMRKTYARNFFAATGDLKALQRELNHKYLDTTLLYLINILGNGRFELAAPLEAAGEKR